MHARTGREREEAGGRRRSGGRANERAYKYICIYKKNMKKKREFVTLIGPAGRWTRDLSVDRGGPNLQDSGTGKNEIGEPRMEKTQRAMWRVEGKLRENFFFPYKKGPRAVQR